VRGAALLVRFLLELAAVASVAAWGWHVVDPVPLKLLLSVACAAVVVAVWGTFVSPKARYPVPDPAWLVIEVLVFVAAALALVAVDDPWGALVLLTVYGVDLAVLHALGERRRATPDSLDGPGASGPPTPR
jgi:uncharacterized protein DUF2568